MWSHNGPSKLFLITHSIKTSHLFVLSALLSTMLASFFLIQSSRHHRLCAHTQSLRHEHVYMHKQKHSLWTDQLLISWWSLKPSTGPTRCCLFPYLIYIPKWHCPWHTAMNNSTEVYLHKVHSLNLKPLQAWEPLQDLTLFRRWLLHQVLLPPALINQLISASAQINGISATRAGSLNQKLVCRLTLPGEWPFAGCLFCVVHRSWSTPTNKTV